MASSIFTFDLQPHSSQMASMIYQILSALPDDETSYFNLQLLSSDELLGEYTTVQTVEETYYNSDERIFEQRKAQKANVVSFNICNNYMEVWGSKANTNRLVFSISNALKNSISINSIEITIKDIVDCLHNYKVKISKVCFEDFLFTEDIVGNFNVDLSSYGDAFSVLDKYKEKIARMTIIIPCEGQTLKISISSKGTIMVYKPRNAFDEDTLDILHAILFK